MTSSLEATACWTAAVRAAETSRDDRLFEDPWAATLAGPEGAAWLAARPPGSTLPIAIRTRFFDDWLHDVAIEAGIRQVVLLAAGLDTRAYRLPWAAATTVFELDRPAVLAGKRFGTRSLCVPTLNSRLKMPPVPMSCFSARLSKRRSQRAQPPSTFRILSVTPCPRNTANSSARCVRKSPGSTE